MQPVAPAALLENLSWRYAVKKFDATKRIPDATWSTLESAVRLAPSSYGFQPWRFYVVTNPQIRQQLRAVSWNQAQITDASHLLVFCQKTTLTNTDVEHYLNVIAAQRGATRESLKGFQDMLTGSIANPERLPGGSVLTYTRSQTYIALGLFLTSAAMLGIDACPMEGFDPAGYDKVLNMSKDGYMPVVLAAAGYRASDDWLASQKKVRFDAGEVIRHIS
jgi:nitroreductase